MDRCTCSPYMRGVKCTTCKRIEREAKEYLARTLAAKSRA